MSGRRRRSEAIWDDKEEQRASAEIHPNISPGRSGYWSKSDAHDDSMRGNFSRSPSRNHLHGNRNGPRDDDIRRDRNRMYSHPTPDGWEKQYNTRPSDESYDLPYRSRDKGVGCNARMSRERERSRSPLRSRSRERERSRSRDCVSRSSRENTRGPRHETDASYPNMRNNSRDFVSRGGDNNTTGSWNSRTDYKGGGGSRYNDHQNTRMPPCKFFAAGNCNRDYCKFSHDVPEASRGYDDNRSIANKNRAWHSDQQAHDDSYAGGFNKTSHQDHTSDDNNNNNNKWDSWDDKKMSFDGHASRDASGFNDVGKSHPNVDNKRSSWNGPTSWDDASGSGFSSVSNPCRRYEETAKESLNDNGDAHGKVEEGDTGNDEKAMRLFKAGLVEFVKEILKPKWKEGKMSRDVYKTVVKKVVEKVTSTIQGTQIPRTQPKIDQYLSYSKPKITKLVEAYMEKLLKS
ncbi:putative transcription factor C3H family [Helianthus annuus]|nr:putative transcription factor C3H family [Helianthus annuus]